MRKSISQPRNDVVYSEEQQAKQPRRFGRLRVKTEILEDAANTRRFLDENEKKLGGHVPTTQS